MCKYKILVINPGSTSTKIAIYENEEKKWGFNVKHPVEELDKFLRPIEQLEYRDRAIRDALKANGFQLDFDAVMARGGLLKPTPSGVYEMNDKIKHDLTYPNLEHPCNLGGMIASDLARDCGPKCHAFISDPEVVDEMMPEAKITGFPQIRRKSVFHALNTKAMGRVYAKSIGKKYEDLNFIMAHLGGGISVSAHCHGKVIDTNNAINGDGPFSPERAGSIPTQQLCELCFSGKYTLAEVKKMIMGRGGCAAHLGTSDMVEIENRALAGEEPFRYVFNSMAYATAKEIGSRAVALKGEVDAIIITGGIAHSKPFVDEIKKWCGWIGKFVVIPGEDEMGSLANNAYRALMGEYKLVDYLPDLTLADLKRMRMQKSLG